MVTNVALVVASTLMDLAFVLWGQGERRHGLPRKVMKYNAVDKGCGIELTGLSPRSGAN